MSLPDLLLPTYRQTLKNLSNWLTKAGEEKSESEADALLTARLAPDMFPLSTQIRFACVQAYEGVYRLKGETFPAALEELLDEGRNAGDRPGTMAEAQARIGETIAFLSDPALDLLAVDPEAEIAHALPMGMIFDLSAGQYARDWALPQFYFHVMIAYAILRSQGIELGKADYVAHMFAYLRPGTMPGS
jgi:hypothetical protein